MNLPPFPVLPLTPEERILWIDWGERVAAAERERCAVVAWSAGMDRHTQVLGMPTDARDVGSACAAAIRKGNQQEGK
jgi:hypothetical protein